MPKKSDTLPEPACRYGYTVDEVRGITGSRFDEFTRWMRGQTMMICDGTKYDYEAKTYVPSDCEAPHGTVIYAWDVERFLKGLLIID